MKYLTLFFSILLFTQTCYSEPHVEKIQFSAFLHLSGEYSMEGNAFKEGMILALEEVNRNLTDIGLTLAIDFQDTRNLSREIVTLAHRASADKEVKAIIVSTFNEVKPIAPILEKSHLPGIVLWDAAPEIDNYGDYVFSIGPWTPDTGEKSARFALNSLKAKKAFVLTQQND